MNFELNRPLRICYDLDATLANCDLRLNKYLLCPDRGFPHKREGKIDWDAFFQECDTDTPIQHMVDNLTWHKEQGADIRIWTGRSDIVRYKTEQWLAKHVPAFAIKPTSLIMRGAADRTDDQKLKINWLKAHQAMGWSPDLVFEDRRRVVDAYRAEGIHCIQVAAGDF